MKIKNFNTDDKVFIIAEIGNNHEGDFKLAKKLIRLASNAGADAVKFQTFVPEKLISISQAERLEQLRRFAFSYKEFEKLYEIALEENILFLSTPFDIESARFLSKIVPAFKIASGDNLFFPLLKEVAQTGKSIIMSTGLSSWDEIIKSKNFIEEIWKSRKLKGELALLHCVSLYPTPFEKADLNKIAELKKIGVTVGYSDHTIGIEAPIIAVALGARIIEKHFTISNDFSTFRDHKLSANPDDFSNMVTKIRNSEKMLSKKDFYSQDENGFLLRRSIAAARDIKIGTFLTWDDITWLRPGNGVPCGKEDLILNRRVIRDIKKGDIIFDKDIE